MSPYRRPHRRPHRWSIEHAADGTATVLRNGRQLRTGIAPETAERYVRAQRRSDEKVIRTDPDGAEQDITRRM